MIRLNNVSKRYEYGESSTVALDAINLNINQGEMVAVIGTSGSGKTTLLNIIGCMDTPSEGQYQLNDIIVSELSRKEMTKVRKENVCFVFQNFALMPDYTAYENIEMPLLIRNVKKKERKERILALMEQLGIEQLVNKLPAQMSGGQQQRVAIARALITGNSLILADEPTGALDSMTSNEIMQLFHSLHEQKHTIIIVTHDKEIANQCERIIKIEDGKLS